MLPDSKSQDMILDKAELKKELLNIYYSVEGNVISGSTALGGCEGLVMYDEPLIGISSADDEIYRSFKDPGVIGELFLLPEEWMPEAKTVISFFLPFSERVRSSNRNEAESTSNEWLHARIEGQSFLERFLDALCRYFENTGIKACAPSIDSRLSVKRTRLPADDPEGIHYSSSWSERHVAYASGLGTFSLSRSLITEKGAAGRYGSIIISAEMVPDERTYSGLSDYCIMCGACIRRCPVGAISMEGGKNQKICSRWVDFTKEKYAPRYGCGKCQTGTPCESRIPAGYKKGD